MAKRESSVTAAGVALLRAIEAQRPEAVRICYDPNARALIPGGISNFLGRLVISSGLYERMAPGTTTFVVEREGYHDDLLKAGWR